MRINRTNYEIFFLDYYEGNLSSAQVEELMAFLDQEPDLKAEFHDFELVRLHDADEVLFEGKASLKRGEITPENCERYFAAYVEGDLNPEECVAVENFAYSSPARQREFELMQKARLQTDYSIVFPGKKALKRGRIIPLYTQMMRYGAVAAVVLFFATLFFVQVPRFNEPQLVDLPPTPIETPLGSAPEMTPEPELAEATEMTPAPAKAVEIARPTTRPRETVRSANISLAQSSVADVPPPMETNRLMARGATPVEASLAEGTSMEQRTEFAYWHLREREEVPPPVRPSSASDVIQLAYNGIQRNMPDNVRQMEERLSTDRRGALREIASVSLNGINNLLGNPLNIERQKDENGKTRQLAIGDAFEVTRE
ncbi:MAG: hypothetical protein V2I46_11760 [Bacteroides sp.]|nr:hypothetical protein [Bacteroides sp.]